MRGFGHFDVTLGCGNDAQAWEQNPFRQMLLPWEYGLGDKMYRGCDELLTEYYENANGTDAAGNPIPLTAQTK